jgi:hypothetical protein
LIFFSRLSNQNLLLFLEAPFLVDSSSNICHIWKQARKHLLLDLEKDSLKKNKRKAMSSIKSLDQKEQVSTSAIDASKAVFATIKKIDSSALEKMIIYNFPGDNTMTVANFTSNGEQKVLLMFLRHFNCIICQATICKVAANYKTLLQLNTVPVLVHQETQECAEDFLTHPIFKNYQPLVKNLLRVSDPQGNFLYKKFNLGKVTLAKANAIKGYPTFRAFNRLGFYNSLFTQERRASAWQMPGAFLVEKARIQNVFEYQFVNSNPLIIDLIVDPEEKGYCEDSFCDLTGNINKFFPKMEGTDTETVSNTEQSKAEETISVEEQKKNVKRSFSKMVDPYSTVETNSSSLFSCQTRLQEDVIPEDVKKSISLNTVLNNKKSIKVFQGFLCF